MNTARMRPIAVSDQLQHPPTVATESQSIPDLSVPSQEVCPWEKSP